MKGPVTEVSESELNLWACVVNSRKSGIPYQRSIEMKTFIVLTISTLLLSQPGSSFADERDERDDAVRALIATSQDEVKEVRTYAIESLGKLKSDREDVAEALAALVEEDDTQVKLAAFEGYLELTIPHKVKVEKLIEWLRESDDEFASTVIDAVMRYPENAIPKLIALLESNMEPDRVKERILHLFTEWGPIAAETGPVLIELYEREPELRRMILETLAEQGTAASPALPVFTKALRDKDPGVRATAAIKVLSVLSDTSAQLDARASRGGASYVKSQTVTILNRYDRDSDGVISLEEAKLLPGGLGATLDRDNDESITSEEISLYYLLRDRMRQSSSSSAFSRQQPQRGGTGRPSTPRQ